MDVADGISVHVCAAVHNFVYFVCIKTGQFKLKESRAYLASKWLGFER